MIDLEAIFSKYRVPYRTQGANCSKHSVNICCVFCGASDHNFHLGVARDGSGYHCLRNPKHEGSLPNLFRKLKIPEKAWAGKVGPVNKQQASTHQPERDYSAFQYFEPAEENQEAVDYLLYRGFTDPIRACRQFNLKVAKTGRWVGRLIIPLSVGWTGRAMRPHMEVRYLSETDETGCFFFDNRASSMFLVEGPLDGMRLATVSKAYNYRGNLGKRITAELIMHIRQRNYVTVYYAPDADVTKLEIFETSNYIRSLCPRQEVVTTTFPTDRKDACAMSETEARKWLMTTTHQYVDPFSRNGLVAETQFGRSGQ